MSTLVAAPTQTAQVQARPSRRTSDPRIHLCGFCDRFGMFGMGEAWMCTEHVPGDFLPHQRCVR